MEILPTGELFPCPCQGEENRQKYTEISEAIERLSYLESRITSDKLLIWIHRSQAKLFLKRAELTEEVRNNRKVLV